VARAGRRRMRVIFDAPGLASCRVVGGSRR